MSGEELCRPPEAGNELGGRRPAGLICTEQRRGGRARCISPPRSWGQQGLGAGMNCSDLPLERCHCLAADREQTPVGRRGTRETHCEAIWVERLGGGGLGREAVGM